ncbi:uncharacterized protein B0P05DRAFT_578297 [Gilbertella persicaria]|uniref:uncharacterized protein n=1 Tax=Gilbertella persicaria TaxID=101096 RepID=UPI0022200037|nr:uncharacterized protein B0P05DRAFT_578297 [Gilbertella persicaria]KAI8085941.1 hypothetical protein B0P05DRAFT_578297 [Gilbertella persicaria]
MELGASLCSMPAGYGHGIRGFAGPKPDPEMFVQWVQQGYPEVLPTIRACIQFRYRPIPYVYSLYVKHVYKKGKPLFRPVFYGHQYDTLTYQQGFGFTLGPSVLIAPIFGPDLKTRKVYLSSQSSCCLFFVKAGSMLIFGKVMSNMYAILDNERRTQIFPEKYVDGAESSKCTFALYEDDGGTLYHETRRAYAEIHITLKSNERESFGVTCPIASETRQLVFEGQDD